MDLPILPRPRQIIVQQAAEHSKGASQNSGSSTGSHSDCALNSQ